MGNKAKRMTETWGRVLRTNVVATTVLLLAGIIGYAERWRYIVLTSPDALPLRVNRWNDNTQYLGNAGWTDTKPNPFDALPELHKK